MDEIISIVLKVIKYIILENTNLITNYNSGTYTIILENQLKRPLTIVEMKINGKDLLTNFSVVEDYRRYPFKIMSNQLIEYNLIISKTDEHPKNFEVCVKRRIGGVKTFFITL